MTVSSKSHQGKEQEEGRSGGKMERKLSELYTRAVSRGQNELIGEFKILADDAISIGGGL